MKKKLSEYSPKELMAMSRMARNFSSSLLSLAFALTIFAIQYEWARTWWMGLLIPLCAMASVYMQSLHSIHITTAAVKMIGEELTKKGRS